MKRIFDFLLAALIMLLLIPILAIITLFIWKNLGKPVLFVQIRPGLHGQPFKMFKFRTMRNALDQDGVPLPDSERLTPFGRFLRASSLDELPELWNVIKGDMSLVGPRPLLMQYLDRYTPYQARRHQVRPGITGWAQVKGRNSLSWDQKFGLDVWYVENQSIALDVKVLLLTIVKVFKRDGISAHGEATMPEFLGSDTPSSNTHDIK